MTKTKKNIIFEIDKDKLWKATKKYIPILAGYFILVFMLIRILCPFALNLMYSLLALYELSLLITDINFKFLAGIVFLFIGWKIFEVFAIVFIRIFEAIISYGKEIK